MATIVLTGATRGLGRALVERFAALKHRVIGCGRSAESVGELKRQFPEGHSFHAVDVADDDAVRSWAQEVIKNHDSPDFLINNAGLINEPSALWSIPKGEFDRVIDVNIKGVANVLRHFVPAMIRRGSGTIVNLSSGWGRSASPNVSPYVASKFAIEGLTKSLAKELPKGLAAIAFNPGVIDTDMLRTCWGKEAGDHERPDEWAARAAPHILSFGPQHNGQSLGMP